jgi:hypothetical protein
MVRRARFMDCSKPRFHNQQHPRSGHRSEARMPLLNAPSSYAVRRGRTCSALFWPPTIPHARATSCPDPCPRFARQAVSQIRLRPCPSEGGRRGVASQKKRGACQVFWIRSGRTALWTRDVTSSIGLTYSMRRSTDRPSPNAPPFSSPQRTEPHEGANHPNLVSRDANLHVGALDQPREYTEVDTTPLGQGVPGVPRIFRGRTQNGTNV